MNGPTKLEAFLGELARGCRDEALKAAWHDMLYGTGLRGLPTPEEVE